jgi:CYTH domain-containing protein
MYDIVYIQSTAYDNNNWTRIKLRFPLAKRVKTFREAQEVALTEFFWTVYDDLAVDEFDFDYVPDEWSREYIHVFRNSEHYDGVALVPKIANVTDKEIDYRFFINKKEVDILASTPAPYDLFVIETYDDYLESVANSTTDMFWATTHNIQVNADFKFDLYFSHQNSYDRKINHTFIHRANGKDLHNGLFLCSKHRVLTQKEIEHRFLVNAKQWDIVASGPVEYPVYEIDSYSEYLVALDTSKTEMFWMSSANISANIPSIYFTHDNEYDRKTNHAFIHRVDNNDYYNGLFLCSKHRVLTQKEIEHRFLVDRKEHDIVASGPAKYAQFAANTYDDYLAAMKTSKTEMFWLIPDYVNPSTRFKFDTYFPHHDTFNRTINHAYLNGKFHDGIILCSKAAKFSKREFEYKFIANKKEVTVVISTPRPFDVVFMSYEEPNADENYDKLLQIVPHAKRIHGVKGIHNAHIEAAKLCDTNMIWVVDADALIVADFKFDFQVCRWDQDVVHVWRSQNPINGLVYGYGGVKLLPTEMTVNMDVSKPDMTTSISSKFRPIHEISNITGFNTDPYNTWKSAFRECVKLSSKIIDRQKDEETQKRLQTWCTVGAGSTFGKYALDGAKQGAMYGARNQHNREALKKINDFDWLKERFNES